MRILCWPMCRNHVLDVTILGESNMIMAFIGLPAPSGVCCTILLDSCIRHKPLVRPGVVAVDSRVGLCYTECQLKALAVQHGSGIDHASATRENE
jgi:hypothetical protein